MKLKTKTINDIAEMICGNFEQDKSYFCYRSGRNLTEFFEDCGFSYVHDGSTRQRWVVDTLKEILSSSSNHPHFLSDAFVVVIRTLMDQSDATNEGQERQDALKQLNISLVREGFQAYYDEYGVCQIRNTNTRATSSAILSPQKAWTKEQQKTREQLAKYLDNTSEDEITEEILLPLFRELGFLRITLAEHKDRALEYGKDVWMKFVLPTQHSLYFGIQVKKGKLDAAGRSQNTNVSEVLHQIRMMLDHEVFDPETNKRALIDHAIIVASGDITKQARNWLGGQLSNSQRSQILFMERSDILDLFLTHEVPLPSSISVPDNEFPF